MAGDKALREEAMRVRQLPRGFIVAVKLGMRFRK